MTKINLKDADELALKEISYKSMTCNPMTMILDEWMLITVGSPEVGYNTMTAR